VGDIVGSGRGVASVWGVRGPGGIGGETRGFGVGSGVTVGLGDGVGVGDGDSTGEGDGVGVAGGMGSWAIDSAPAATIARTDSTIFIVSSVCPRGAPPWRMLQTPGRVRAVDGRTPARL
jgi:hypothetical protein